MSIIERVKNICLTPKTEWAVIAEEPSSTSTLIGGYLAPLAALDAVAGFIGASIIGVGLAFIGTVRTPFIFGLTTALFGFIVALIAPFILAFIINALAPTFGAEKSASRAMKVAVYCYTPALVAGLLRVLPGLGLLAAFIGIIYGFYLMYLGLQSLMKTPPDRAVGYTAVVVVCAIVVSVVLGVATATVAGIGALGAGVATRGLGGGPLGSSSSSSSDVKFNPNSPLGKLQQLGDQLEQSNKKMAAAEKSGDSAAATAAAFEGLGTLLGGGKRVEPVDIEQLKPFVPDTFAGLPKTRSNFEKNGMAGLSVSKAHVTYSAGEKTVTLELSDTGGISGIVGLATWVGVQGEKEDENAIERDTKQNGRLVHERQAKNPNGRNEFGIVLGERFVINASGEGVDLATLKSAVSTLDLSKLESMKEVGTQK